jgi:LysM repeat protein
MTVFLLKDGVIRATVNEADRALFAKDLVFSEVIPVSISGMEYIPKSVTVLPVGLVVKNKSTGVTGLIDSSNNMITFGPNSMALKLPTPRILSTIQLVGYPIKSIFGSFKLWCSGQIFVVANGLAHTTTVQLAKELPGVSNKLSDSSCAQLSFTDKTYSGYIGHETVDPISKKVLKKTYKVLKGKRLPFKNSVELAIENSEKAPILWVDDAFIKNLPLGNQMVVKAVVVPNSPPQVKPKSYIIVAGDTLSSIAIKFKTTVAILMSLNKITNSNRVNVGQLLKLP